MLSGMTMHDDQVDITADAVATLVSDRFPEWSGLSVVRVHQTGTVHTIFRIGDEFAVRFPLRPAEPAAVRQELEAEQRALAELGDHLDIAVPTSLGLGEPGAGYPMAWAAQTWLPGEPAWDVATTGADGRVLDDVVTLLADLRSIPVRGRTFSRRGRGGDLRHHDGWVATCLDRSAGLLPVDELGRIWQRLRDLPRHSPDTITHGDLIPGNLLVDDGRLVGVLDPGMFGAADPALDLIVAWHLFEAEQRSQVRDRLTPLGVTDLDWERGKAWAFEQALGLVWYYQQSNPTVSQQGRRTLTRILGAD